MSYEGPGQPSSRHRRSVSRRDGGGTLPLLLSFLLVAGLIGLAFLQARLLSPLLFASRDPAPNVSRPVNLPEREVRVLVSEEETDPDLLLKTSLDLPEANEEEAARLDRALFPDGERHRYWVLVARNRGEGEVPLDVDPAQIRLRGPDGEEWAALDLRAILDARSAEIPAPLRLWLRLRVSEEVRLALKPGGGRTLLLAFSEEAAPDRVEAGAIGERELRARSVRKDTLDQELERPDDDGAGEGT